MPLNPVRYFVYTNEYCSQRNGEGISRRERPTSPSPMNYRPGTLPPRRPHDMTTQATKVAVRSRVRKELRAGNQNCQTGSKAPALNVRLALAGHPLAIVGFPIPAHDRCCRARSGTVYSLALAISSRIDKGCEEWERIYAFFGLSLTNC